MAEHATTGDAINHAVDKASDGIAQITHAISGAAPKVAEVTLAAVQADAFANVIYGAEALAVVAALLFIWRKLYWPWVKSNSSDFDMEFPVIISGFGLCVGMALFLFIAICTIFDPWTYVAMQHPDLYLAHKVMASLSK